MSSREEFEVWLPSIVGGFLAEIDLARDSDGSYNYEPASSSWRAWKASRAHESDLLAALKAITNSGPDAIPIKEAFEMAHRAIERATGGNV